MSPVYSRSSESRPHRSPTIWRWSAMRPMAIRDCQAGVRSRLAAVLAKFVHLESIPLDSREWRVNAANASALAATLSRERERALLFRTLATLRTDIALFDHVDELRWNGPTPVFAALAAQLDAARTEIRRSVVPRSRTAPILRSAARQ